MQLETKYAEKIISLLEDAQDVGMPHVIFELRPQDMELQPHQLNLFETLGEALDYLDSAAGNNYLPGDADHPVYYRHADQLVEEIKQANLLTINKLNMNLNNLENLREELKTLGFKDKVISEIQQHMEKGISEFTLHDSIPGTRGQVDMSLYFKQSGQSEHYFFNKYEVALNSGKALEEGQKYTIITPNEQGKNMFKSFENVAEAIAFFKDQKGNSELALMKGEGKESFEHRAKLAMMESGKINYVAKDFQHTFRTPAVTQTFYVDRGKGFTAEQAANLIQGRSVYRDDMANVAGQTYKAWVKLDMDHPKDLRQNFYINQYHDPSYGFNLEKVLNDFKIKELKEPEQAAALDAALRNGNRPLITTVKEGQEVKLFIEASPRYGKLNFFAENGKPEKREQFLKEPLQEQTLKVGKVKGQEKEQGQGMAI